MLAVLGSCLGAACGGTTPIDPSPLPQPLSLSCPISIVLEATQPGGASATFDPPVAREGRPPYTVECSPGGADAVFPVGQTRVNCTATDTDQTQKACSFDVEVRVSRTLEKTRYLSFGDSITAGTVSPAPVLLDNPDSYPYKLQRMLRESYPAQDIDVLNYGNGGERLQQGAARLPGVLAAERPEVLLLLQGIISVREIPTATNARHLRTMITDARQRGIDVMIATVMPVGAGLEARQPGINAAVVALNAEIGRLAQEFGLGAPVDLYGLFHAEPRLIGRDDLHPTEEGFTRIAETFKNAVVSRYHKHSP
jgi:lysophospholipase L1-like esterase